MQANAAISCTFFCKSSYLKVEGGSLDELFFEVSEIKLINIFLKISVCPFRL